MTVTNEEDCVLLDVLSSLFHPEPDEQLTRASTTCVPQIQFHEDLDVRVIISSIMASDDVAVVRIEAGCYSDDDGLLYVWQIEGSAKRGPEDAPDRQTGIALATARAFQRLANQFHAQAEGRVENADKMFIQRGEQMVKNDEWKTKQRQAGEWKAKQRKARKENAEMIDLVGQNPVTAMKPAKKIKKKVNA